MARTVVEDAMTDPMLVRRLALDLRNLADKTPSSAARSRTTVTTWSAPSRTTGATWTSSRPSTARSRSCGSSWIDRGQAAQRQPWRRRPLARIAAQLGPRLPTEGPMIIVTRLPRRQRGGELRPHRAGRGEPGHRADPGGRGQWQGERARDRRQGPRLPRLAVPAAGRLEDFSDRPAPSTSCRLPTRTARRSGARRWGQAAACSAG